MGTAAFSNRTKKHMCTGLGLHKAGFEFCFGKFIFSKKHFELHVSIIAKYVVIFWWLHAFNTTVCN
jgi:hypothetical protein